MLQFMGLQRVRHDLATEQQQPLNPGSNQGVCIAFGYYISFFQVILLRYN